MLDEALRVVFDLQGDSACRVAEVVEGDDSGVADSVGCAPCDAVFGYDFGQFCGEVLVGSWKLELPGEVSVVQLFHVADVAQEVRPFCDVAPECPCDGNGGVDVEGFYQ